MPKHATRFLLAAIAGLSLCPVLAEEKSSDALIETLSKAIDALYSHNKNTRIEALAKLSRVGSVELPRLFPLIKDGPMATRAVAMRTIASIRPPPKDALAPVVEVLRGEIHRIHALIDRRYSGEPDGMAAYEFSACIFTLLHELGPEAVEAVPALIDVVKDASSPGIKCSSISALGQIGPAARHALDTVATNLRDPTLTQVSVVALKSFCSENWDAGKRRYVTTNVALLEPPLLNALEIGNAKVRLQIIEGIYGIPMPKVISTLIARYRSDRELQRPILSYLGSTGSAAMESLPLLLEVLGDVNMYNSAAFTIGKLGGRRDA